MLITYGIIMFITALKTCNVKILRFLSNTCPTFRDICKRFIRFQLRRVHVALVQLFIISDAMFSPVRLQFSSFAMQNKKTNS